VANIPARVTTKVMHMRRALLIIPFIVPFVFHAFYQPINEAWTVERFGCGCPPIRNAGAFRFNANYFNLVLWCGVALVCGLSWWLLLRREITDRKAMHYLVAQLTGLAVLTGICFNRLGKEFWL
jgi:hypothetical protein